MRPYLCALVLLLAPLGVIAAPAPLPAPAPAGHFGVAAHSDVNIEWWYVNAHVTTEKGRHLALIGSFFRFGSGVNPLDGSPMPRAHYLIYAVTDLDAKTQRPYSLADGTMINLLKQFGPLLAVQNPGDKSIQTFMADINKGKLPPPSQEISGKSTVVNSPFRIAYGADNTLAATNSANTSFDLNLNAGGPDKIHLTLESQKPPMAVGGKGETGLKSPTDMYYFSLTRCAVGGTIDTGAGPEKITGGAGWFDHQWGNSWVASGDGWDWWGVQLDDGTDILFFRQRDLKTGRIFYPLATFMDKAGHQSVTKNIVFTPDPKAYWKSPKSGVTYPLGWTVTFPDKNLQLHITADVQDQEMPILGPGAGIWEGLCHVMATEVQAGPNKPSTADVGASFATPGVAYMELVGYGSPAVKAKIKGK
jgi:predicted secreted hydrolase